MQHRSKTFDQTQAIKYFEQMNEDAKASLIEDYIREEVLHRSVESAVVSGQKRSF